jgi:plastocyanin
MIASKLPSRAVLVALAILAVAVAACSSPGASSGWSFGPSLAPAASGSGAPPASAPSSASAPPSANATASAPPSTGASASPAGETTTLVIGTKPGDDLEFDPDEVSVPAGAKVSITFENRSALPHNLTFRAPIDAASDPVVAAGASDTVDFTAPAPGDYVFACAIHPGMQGKLTVAPAG